MSITGAAGLALYAPRFILSRPDFVFMCGYAALFLALLCVALYCALLDLQYIRLQYVSERRQVFKETLGSEEFRQALRQAERRDQDPTQN